MQWLPARVRKGRMITGSTTVVGRKEDPAFLYFPANYRWSMGLLICLGAAPWTGIEIDEVHRVGRALEDRIGDDTAWFEEWSRMADKIAACKKPPRKRESAWSVSVITMRPRPTRAAMPA